MVERNQFWFEQNIHELATLWEIVKAERVTGFQHRAPNRKNSTKRTDSNGNSNIIGGGCLLKLNKLTGQTNINIVQKDKPIIKIDTQANTQANRIDSYYPKIV